MVIYKKYKGAVEKMTEQVRVSFTNHVDQILAEEKMYEEKGFLVVDSYEEGQDFGHVMEWAKGENRVDVLTRHYEHDIRMSVS